MTNHKGQIFYWIAESDFGIGNFVIPLTFVI